MKKNYKIKLICLLCAFTALLSNCKKGETVEEQGLSGKHNGLAIAGDGKWDLLGYGYDLTGELFSPENASDAQVIDVNRFNTDYPNRINTPTSSYGYNRLYTGATALDYIKDVNKQETYGLKTSIGEKEKNTFGSFNFSKANEYQNTYTYNSRYSYATFETRVLIKSINFSGDATLDILKNYLTPLFIANLSNYSAEALVERYGTHVLLGISIGGRLKYDYRGSVIKETTFERKKTAIKTGFSIGVDKIFGIDFSSDVSREQKLTILNETANKNLVATFYGGTNSGFSFSTDPEGKTSQNVSLASWQQSINVNNATLIDINRSVPIYDLISDPIKKQQVKDAVEKYIADRQVKEFEDKTTVQLYRCYYPGNDDRLLVVDPNEVAGLPGWQVEGPFVKVYKYLITGTTPLYRFYLKDRRHLHSLNRDEITPSVGTYEGIIGYVETQQTPTNKKLYRYYKKSGSHMYAKDFKELGWGKWGYIYEGDLGYAVGE